MEQLDEADSLRFLSGGFRSAFGSAFGCDDGEGDCRGDCDCKGFMTESEWILLFDDESILVILQIDSSEMDIDMRFTGNLRL